MSQITKRISVIIPAYNIESLLEKCVDSVATQDYPEGLLEVCKKEDYIGQDFSGTREVPQLSSLNEKEKNHGKVHLSGLRLHA